MNGLPHLAFALTRRCAIVSRLAALIVYRVVGYGRGDGRHSAGHRRSVVYSLDDVGL